MEPFQVTPQIGLHYEESGQGTQAILAIHVVSSALLNTWDDVRPELEKTYRL